MEEYQSEYFSSSSPDIISGRHFNFEQFCYHMKKSILRNSGGVDDIDLESYLLAFEQLHNFFILLGRAFQFVAIDLSSKIKVLKSYRRNENENHPSKNFLTIKTMVDYEKKNDLMTNLKYISGCRTLLRLHRGLDFVRKFLDEIYKLENDAKLCDVAKIIYNQTLAEHHSWMVKNAARMAMQLLPTRMQLLNQNSASGSDKDLNQILELFPCAIEAMNVVYDTVQGIYSANNLLELP